MKTFNRKISRLSCYPFRILSQYDSFNMVSHKVDSDSSGGFDFNYILNSNLYAFLYFQKEVYVTKDSHCYGRT
jgi:hypothetical protein